MRTWLLVLASMVATGANAQELFTVSSNPVSETQHPVLPWVQKYETYRIDKAQLTQFLDSTPMQTRGFTAFRIINLPTPDGRTARFKIAESPIMSPAVQAHTPVRTYKLVGLDDLGATGRLDWGINGFHGLVMTSRGSYIIDPPALGNRDYAVSYYRRDNLKPKNFLCFTPNTGGSGDGYRHLVGDTLKTYRLAMNATGEYTAVFGGQAGGEAAIVTSVNRVNQVYEEDFAIHMNIIYKKAWTDPNTDPFTNNDGGTMLGQNQQDLDAAVGDANYDMGHVFSTGGGGIASINSVGVTGRKAQGVTGLPNPQGDDFDIDFVAHEMGHQFGGHHPFNGTGGNCGGAKDSPHAYEPGSGTTIMAYAGICAADDIQPHSDPYFHVDSLDSIIAWRDNAQSGGTAVSNGNILPTVNAGADYTIPQNTPYKLTATGADGNNDPLFFCWEQFDLGNTDTTQPIYRSLNPSSSPTRFFPKLATVLAGTADRWEPMVIVDRAINFRVTARDRRAGGGGIATDAMKVTVAGSAFTVTAPTGNQNWLGGSQQTVSWNVGGGSVAANVNILLSLDGGTSYGTGGAVMVLANTPNDGTQLVTIPQVATANGRIIVEAADNIFFNVSTGAITVTPTQVPKLSDLTLGASSIVGGFNVTGTVHVDVAGAVPSTMNLSSDNANATVPATATVPAGSTSKDFTITTTAVANDQFATITATQGVTTKTKQLEIVRDIGPVNMSFNPSTIGGGAKSTGTVFLNRPAPPGGVVVNMSDNGPELAVNPNVIVASGYAQQNFTVVTYAVNASVVRQITATRAGQTVIKSVTIVPFMLADFTIAPSGVVGGNDATGTLTINAPAPQAGITVGLSANSNLLTVPASQTIPVGATSIQFPIHTGTVSAQVMRQVSATFGTQKMTRNLVIMTADLASITVSPQTIHGGQNATGTINLNGNAGTNFVVNLSSSGAELHVPATVTVPFGQKSVNFNITSSAVQAGRTRIVTATRNGRTRTFAVVILR